MKFYITLPDPGRARGELPALSFSAHGAEALAEQLRHALADRAYSQAWLATLDEDAAEHIDPALLAVDAAATVTGVQRDLAIELVADTRINGTAFKHRMRLWPAHSGNCAMSAELIEKQRVRAKSKNFSY